MSSWLSEIAGKAEDILNKMDQRAANVLSTTEEKVKEKRSNVVNYDHHDVESYSYGKESVAPSHQRQQYQQQQPLQQQQHYQHSATGYQQSAPHSRSSSISSSFSTISSREVANNISSNKHSLSSKPFDVDEKLFEFLNSKGSSGASTHGSDSPKTDGTSEDKQWSEIESPEEAEIIQDKSEIVNEKTVNVKNSSTRILELKEQIKSLTKEITQLTKRNVDLETDYKRLQKRLDNWQAQIATSEDALRELQSRDSDLRAAIDAKDSQLAVLKVRLQEVDENLNEKQTIIKQLQEENETLIKEREDNFTDFDENLVSLRNRIKELEALLLSEKELRLQTQQETMNTISRYQENQRQLSEEIANLQKQCALEKTALREMEKQFTNLQSNHESLENELDEYKLRAQRTLQAKDDLIKALQSEGSARNQEDINQINSLLQTEVDTLLMEVQDLRNKNETLKKELESIKQNQVYVLNDRINELSIALEERHSKASLEDELRRIQDELKFSQDNFEKTKATLSARIQDRDSEIEKLRKQLVSKRSPAQGSSSYEELETRIKNLTENLIQKQTYVEQLSSERHSLALQLERAESRLRESLDTIANSKNVSHIPDAVTIGMVHSSSASNLVNRVRPLVEESPYDGQVTRRVKRAYGFIDSFSIRLGLMLRHYPSARAFVIIYILLLHIWVMFVLFNYRPSINEP